MFVETNRLYIRHLIPNDLAELFKILSDAETMRFIEHPYTMEQTARFMEEAGLCNPPKVYAAKLKTGKLIGHVIYHPYNKIDCYEIGWVIRRDYWNQGFAKEITQSLMEAAGSQGIKQLVVECDLQQKVSKHIANIFGFKKYGENEKLAVYQKKL